MFIRDRPFVVEYERPTRIEAPPSLEEPPLLE